MNVGVGEPPNERDGQGLRTLQRCAAVQAGALGCRLPRLRSFLGILMACAVAVALTAVPADGQVRTIWVSHQNDGWWFRVYGFYACGDWAFEYPYPNNHVRFVKIYNKARSYNGSGATSWRVDRNYIREWDPYTHRWFGYHYFGASAWHALAFEQSIPDYIAFPVDSVKDGQYSQVTHYIDIEPNRLNVGIRRGWNDASGNCLYK